MVKIGMMIADRYEVLEKIGTGGMSDVYKAKDHKLNRAVAIKILKQEFSENGSFVSKFRTEAQAAAGLMHANIVNVYDVGEEGGVYYIVMELVEGMTLKKYIEMKSHLSVKEAISIAIQVSLGIEAAHNNHIIHRDIKPQNIMISKQGRVKVTDFGIAKAATSNTITSNVMGSVHYTSPEQARGGYSDAKSDIYSLGITLFEMLTGRVPFNGDTTVAIAIKHIQNPMPSPRDFVADIPVSVEKIVLKCTQKSPDSRYQSMTELVEDLKRSLITPDEDFVVMNSNSAIGATRTVSDDEINAVRRGTDRIKVKEEDLAGDSGKEAPVRRENKPHSENAKKADAPSKSSSGKDSGYRVARPEEKRSKNEDNPVMEKITTVLMVVVAIVIALIVLYIVGRLLGVFPLGGEKVSGENPTVTEAPVSPQISQDESKDVPTPAEGMSIVPDVSKDHSLLQAEATKKLADLGFKVEVEKKTSEDVPKGYVISQTPQAGQEVTFGSTVTLLISDGASYSTVVVPNLLGISAAEAEESLNAVGLMLGTIEEGYSDEYPSGQVFYQSYTAGGNVATSTVVDIKVSIGAEPRSYACNMVVEAPADPEYAGTEAVVMLVGTDNNIYYNTTTNVFPITINVSGIRDVSSGAVVINYNVAVTTIGYDAEGNAVPTATVETRSYTQAVVFTEE